MGRGRAKAKQTKVARELKYSSPQTDFDRLQRGAGRFGRKRTRRVRERVRRRLVERRGRLAALSRPALLRTAGADPRAWLAGRLLPFLTVPSVQQLRCRAVRMASARSVSSGATTATMPTPMLKVFSISARSMRPRWAIIPNTGAGVQVPRSSSATRPCGMTRSRLPASPPPVTWQNVRTWVSAASARQSLA